MGNVVFFATSVGLPRVRLTKSVDASDSGLVDWAEKLPSRSGRSTAYRPYMSTQGWAFRDLSFGTVRGVAPEFIAANEGLRAALFRTACEVIDDERIAGLSVEFDVGIRRRCSGCRRRVRSRRAATVGLSEVAEFLKTRSPNASKVAGPFQISFSIARRRVRTPDGTVGEPRQNTVVSQLIKARSVAA
jgi:hypothetical protein